MTYIKERTKLRIKSKEELINLIISGKQLVTFWRNETIQLRGDLRLIKKQIGRIYDNIRHLSGSQAMTKVRYYSGGKESKNEINNK